MMLVNMKSDTGRNRITFQGCRLHWSSSFLMAQLKRSWQNWHSCIVESLSKTLMHRTKPSPDGREHTKRVIHVKKFIQISGTES